MSPGKLIWLLQKGFSQIELGAFATDTHYRWKQLSDQEFNDAEEEHDQCDRRRSIDGDQAEQLAADVTALIARGEVTFRAPAEALVHDGAKAYQVEADSPEQRVTSVSFPISGSFSEPVSNLTVLFDDDRAVVQYSETLFSQGDSGTFLVAAGVEAVAANNNTAACLSAVLSVSAEVVCRA